MEANNENKITLSVTNKDGKATFEVLDDAEVLINTIVSSLIFLTYTPATAREMLNEAERIIKNNIEKEDWE